MSSFFSSIHYQKLFNIYFFYIKIKILDQNREPKNDIGNNNNINISTENEQKGNTPGFLSTLISNNNNNSDSNF